MLKAQIKRPRKETPCDFGFKGIRKMASVETANDAMVSVTQLVYETAFESNDHFRELAEKKAAEKRQEEATQAKQESLSSSPDVIVDVSSDVVTESAPAEPASQAKHSVDVTA